jgi:hypothetical protein
VFNRSGSGKRAADDADRLTASLTAAVAVLILVVVSLVIVRKLQVRVLLEECVMSQSPGCEAAIEHLRVSRMIDRLFAAGS